MSSRRVFMGAAGAAATHIVARRAAGANDKLRVAILGVNGRGKDHMQGIMSQPDADVVMFCDVDLEVAGKTAAMFEKRYGKKVEIVQDFRKVLERKDIDAVTVATPNHWHALATIWACQAGKDVYVEKPGAHNVFEGRKMVEAAHKYNRIVQHGVQLRSSEALQEAVEQLRKGVIGNVYMSRGLVFRWRPSIGKKGVEPVPSELELRPLDRPGHHGAVSAGASSTTTGTGTGTTATATSATRASTRPTCACGAWASTAARPRSRRWAASSCSTTTRTRRKSSLPSITIRSRRRSSSSKCARGAPTTRTARASATSSTARKATWWSRATTPTRSTWGRSGRRAPGARPAAITSPTSIKAIRSRKTADQNGPVETAHLSSALAHLGNISYRLDRVLTFDPAKEKFVGDKEADKLLTREYRKPYVVPDKV